MNAGERKEVWSECENGEGEWGERLVRGSRASHARLTLMALRAFRKRPKTTVLQSMCLVSKSVTASEAGGELALRQTSQLFSFKCKLVSVRTT